MFEIYHIGYAVRNLERALRDFHSALGGRLTEPTGVRHASPPSFGFSYARKNPRT